MTLQADEKLLPRLCRLTRESHVDQYGFDFIIEGNYIINVLENYPADIAGLRDGDYILEVNGESIDGMKDDAVVNKIFAHQTRVDFLVVNKIGVFSNELTEKSVEPPVKKTTVIETISESKNLAAPSQNISGIFWKSFIVF
jgi:C-terminal processing protease CtpA/Prc